MQSSQVQSRRFSPPKSGQILIAPGEGLSLHIRGSPLLLQRFWEVRLPWEMPAGIWQEEHPSDAAAAAAAWCWLAVVTAGWVPALFASALRVNREQAKCQRIPREADVIANSLVPDTVLET